MKSDYHCSGQARVFLSNCAARGLPALTQPWSQDPRGLLSPAGGIVQWGQGKGSSGGRWWEEEAPQEGINSVVERGVKNPVQERGKKKDKGASM